MTGTTTPIGRPWQGSRSPGAVGWAFGADPCCSVNHKQLAKGNVRHRACATCAPCDPGQLKVDAEGRLGVHRPDVSVRRQLHWCRGPSMARPVACSCLRSLPSLASVFPGQGRPNLPVLPCLQDDLSPPVLRLLPTSTTQENLLHAPAVGWLAESAPAKPPDDGARVAPLAGRHLR